MKTNENLSMLVVPQSETLTNSVDSTLSGVKIIGRKKTEDEIRKEEELKQYVNFFQKEIRNIEKLKAGQSYNAIEIANEQFLTVTDYLNRDIIQAHGIKINYQINTLDSLMRLIENPGQLQKVNLIHAVMPFEDVASLIYPLARIPQLSRCKTRVILGAYGNLEDTEEFDYNNRVINAMYNQLDFNMYKEEIHNHVYTKMLYSTYKQNMKMKH